MLLIPSLEWTFLLIFYSSRCCWRVHICSNLATLCSGISASKRCLIHSNLAALRSHDSFANVTFLFSKRIFLSTGICDIRLALTLALLFPNLIFLFFRFRSPFRSCPLIFFVKRARLSFALSKRFFCNSILFV